MIYAHICAHICAHQLPRKVLASGKRLHFTMERSTIFNGKTRYLYGHFQLQTVTNYQRVSTENSRNQLTVGSIDSLVVLNQQLIGGNWIIILLPGKLT